MSDDLIRPVPSEVLPPETPAAKDESSSRWSLTSIEASSGTLPPPAMLERYDRIMPGFAAKLLTSYIEEGEHRRKLDLADNARTDKLLDHKIRYEVIGQIVGSFACVIALSIAGLLAWQGHGWHAAITIAAVFGTVGTAYMVASKKPQ